MAVEFLEGFEMKCPKCGYEWTPRVAAPRRCPACKAVLQMLTKVEERKPISQGGIVMCNNCKLNPAQFTFRQQSLCKLCMLEAISKEPLLTYEMAVEQFKQTQPLPQLKLPCDTCVYMGETACTHPNFSVEEPNYGVGLRIMGDVATCDSYVGRPSIPVGTTS